jgi:hypothetical protein
MSILEGLPSDAEKAMLLLKEEDRFYDSMSSHDQLTRLALTIETDTEETLAVPDDTNNWIQCLRDKIERLQLANKEIHKDICTLHTNFQVNISSSYLSLAHFRMEININFLSRKVLEGVACYNLFYF